MADLYKGVPGVRNTVVNEPLSTPLVDDTSEALFIFGTAESGTLYTPLKPATDASSVEAQFGSLTVDGNPYAHRSIVKAYYEALAAGGGDPNFNVRLIRVGKVASNAIDLYEYASGSGVHAVTGNQLALRLSYATPGKTGSGSTVNVAADASGVPTAITISLDNGISKTFALDATGVNTSYINNVAELVDAIAADADLAAAGIIPSTQLITEEVTKTYATPTIDLSSDAKGYGNNLVDITSAYSYSTRSEILAAGSATAVLTEVPEKDFDGATPTISSFAGIKTNALEKTAVLADVGGNAFTLSCASDAKRIAGDAITVSELKILRGASFITFAGAKYTVNLTTGVVTLTKDGDFLTGFVVGDKVYVTYEYALGYAEKDVRSTLIVGDRSSYFVSGDSIIFGAAQITPVKITYRGKREYTWGSDIILQDRATSKIRFVRADNIPTAGDELHLNVRYLPELPAATGTVLKDGVSIQSSSFTGGSDGQSMSASEYKKEIEKALKLTFGYPCAGIIIAGAYLDDTTTGYNSETGRPETVSINWHGYLSDYAIRKSNYVSECKVYLPIRPLTAFDIETKNTYVERMTVVDPSDPFRPANLITLIDAYNMIVPVNDFSVQVPSVYNAAYITSPAVIYAVTGMLQDKAVAPINITRKMPACVVGLALDPQGWETMKQINNLRYTFFQKDLNSTAILPSDAPTLATYGSSLDRQYVLDIVFMVMKDLRRALQPFIGRPNDDRTRTVMENLAKSTLAKRTPEFISGYDVSISANTQDKIDGNTVVKYVIKTSREIRTISQETRIKLV